MSALLPQKQTSVSASAMSISHPAPHPLNIIFISRSELTAHLGLLEGDVDPLSGGEGSDRRNNHGPGADPKRDAQSEDPEAQIHRVGSELVGTVRNQFAIGGRSWVDFGPLTTKQENCPDRWDECNRQQTYS